MTTPRSPQRLEKTVTEMQRQAEALRNTVGNFKA